MKKYYMLVSVFVWLFFSNLALGQLNGDGTSSNPFSGTVPASDEWIGEIYANNLVIPTGVVLTISPGVEASHLNMINFTLTINEGGTLIINPNASATIYEIINNGTLILESGSTEFGVASLIHNSYSGSGITRTNLFLRSGLFGSEFVWHYISMPVTGIAATLFNTLNLAQFLESETTSEGNDSGWITYQGYQYSTTNTNEAYEFNTLELGKGYNYYNVNPTTFTLQGTLNIFTIRQNLSYSGASDYEGFNLIGNPFASCIDWESLVGTYTSNVSNAIYFTNRDKMAAYVGGTSVNGGTEFIPPLQGFFVKSTSPGGYVDFVPEARVHSPDQMRYKKKSADVSGKGNDTISFFRLRLATPGDSTDVVVRFNKMATDGFDRELDAYTFNREMGNFNIWTTTGNTDYCINALPFPVESVIIPIGVNIKIPGTYKLSSAELKKLDLYNITLTDLMTSQVADLKKGEYVEFTSDAGLTENRFIITVTKSATDIAETLEAGKFFAVYTDKDRTINIRSLRNSNAIFGSIRIYDLTGRKIYDEPKVEWSGRFELRQIKLNNPSSGIYLVELMSGANRFVTKVALK